jgi:glucosamine-6-phosphate deaminase
MEIIIERDYGALSDEACRIVLAEVGRKRDLVLGLATGRTPIGLYERLRRSKDAFPAVRFFNLDEFFGRGPRHADSFCRFLHAHLLDHVTHDPANVRLLRGDAPDLEAEAREYEERIRSAGGVDLQILGLGGNGHIGFNEPGSSLGSRTRPKTLEPATLAEYLEDLDPGSPATSFTITMGLGTILEARKVLLLASGAKKAEAVRLMVEGPVSAEVPASVLQMHPRVTAIVDEAAASRLKRVEYYKWVKANKWRLGQ